jgi:hypothetical protein
VERKKVIKWAAIAGAIVLFLSVTAMLAVESHRRSSRRESRERREKELAGRRKEYQAYVDESAQRLRGLPAEPRAVAEIQARYNRELPAASLYVWATRNDGEFVFGVPTDAFARLNAAFDRHRALITEDNHYASRDQFLRALLHHNRAIPLTPPSDKDDDDRRHRRHNDEEDWWRFQPEQHEYWHDGDTHVLFVSSPIDDGSGKTVGSLNLKVVERRTQHGDGFDAHDAQAMSGIAIFFSALWLWFLLPSWVYIDARERGVPRPMLWALLTLVGSVFALLVYLVSRPAGPQELRCPKCSKTLNGSKAGCPYCGADLSSAFCPQCQYPLKPEWGFCPSCRTAIPKTLEPAKEGA